MAVGFQSLPISPGIFDHLLRRARVNRQEQIDSQTGSYCDSIKRTRRHVKWRQRPLDRFGVDHDFRNLEEFSIESQNLFRPGPTNDLQSLHHKIVCYFVVCAKAFVSAAVRMTAAGSEIHATAGKYVEHRGLFRPLYRMMNRQGGDGGAEPQTSGSLRCRAAA